MSPHLKKGMESNEMICPVHDSMAYIPFGPSHLATLMARLSAGVQSEVVSSLYQCLSIYVS